MRKIIISAGFIILLIFFICCTNHGENVKADKSDSSFTFAFLTDVHLNANNFDVSSKGLRQALEHAKSKEVDFVIFGGDLVDLDGLQPQDSLKADSLLSAFKSIIDESGIEAYFTIGNHDRFYTYRNKTDSSGFELFSKHLGDTYFSFDRQGVHFVVLNSVQIDDSTRNYHVGPEQIEWLKADLSKLSPQTPLVVSTHVPFQSLYYPAVEGVVRNADMFSNFKEVWDLLLGHDLKIILQGHQHLHEELLVNDTYFVTGGAVSAAWWSGPLLNTEEGYILVSMDEEQNFSWEYMDYGWEADSK
ncbi:MAG: metallophosphoesterase [Proteiniphilum sp.]|nr:metallophosphoesterase [Porphyromonadaceae bacterium]